MCFISVREFAIAFYVTMVVIRKSDEKLFLCNDGRSIDKNDNFCTGIDTCKDGSDEGYGCNLKTCGSGKFACKNSLCLPISVRCDLKNDCGDGSDEVNCGTQFQCNNGDFINGRWFCDGEIDCLDGNDESYGCDYDECGRGEFRCNDESCIPISGRCDTKLDCNDGSDEHNCNHVLSLTNCTIRDGKYLCKDETRCISLKYACDGNYTCMDRSDEHENCIASTDLCDLTCPHNCWRSPDGPLCFCSSINLSFDQEKCSKLEDCSLSEDKCEQICLKYHNMTQCSCNEGYIPATNYNGSCLNTAQHENVLLFSNETNIVGYKLVTKESFFILSATNVTSISAANDHVYWSILSNNEWKIFRTHIRNAETALVYQGKNHSNSLVITSIAVDWIANNIFFTSQTSLSVCKNDGNICAQLKHSEFGIEYVALLPRKGLMFWIQNTKNKYDKFSIMKSSMDGTNERVLVDENLHFSNELAVDESSERIYWIDHVLSVIESIKYDGKQRKIEISETQNVFSFSVFERKIYRTLNFNNGIFVGKNVNIWLRGNLGSTMKKIHIFNPALQRTKILNPCVSMPCAGLCLLHPVSMSRMLNRTCLSQSYKLEATNEDQHTTPAKVTSLPMNSNDLISVSTEQLSSEVTVRNLPKNSKGYFHPSIEQTSHKMIVEQHHPTLEQSTYEVVEKFVMRILALIFLLYIIFILYSRFTKTKIENGQILSRQDENMIDLEFKRLACSRSTQ